MINQLNKVRELNQTVNSKAQKFGEIICYCIHFIALVLALATPFPVLSSVLVVGTIINEEDDLALCIFCLVVSSVISVVLLSYYEQTLFPMFH